VPSLEAVDAEMAVSVEAPECNGPWPNVGQRSPAAGRETEIAAALAELITTALTSPPSTATRLPHRPAATVRKPTRPTDAITITPDPKTPRGHRGRLNCTPNLPHLLRVKQPT
jgi:hypothetical protein